MYVEKPLQYRAAALAVFNVRMNYHDVSFDCDPGVREPARSLVSMRYHANSAKLYCGLTLPGAVYDVIVYLSPSYDDRSMSVE